jgi:hypothetical protein
MQRLHDFIVLDHCFPRYSLRQNLIAPLGVSGIEQRMMMEQDTKSIG